jgi:hypothetical protein
MKKLSSLLLFISLISFTALSINVKSQTTAMDFEQDECSGTPHHLYAELDAGNVVILEYVMLNCAPCIIGTKALESLTSPYEISHPGRVHIYSFAFLNSYTCEQILAWKSDNNFTHPVFNNGEEQVDYYGGMGMPTIVVVGTNEHKVFFKSIGYTSAIDDLIREALDSALIYNPMGIGEQIPVSGFSIYPTLFTDRLNVVTNNEFTGTELFIYDTFGREVVVSRVPESGNLSIPVAGLSRGIYIARLKTNSGFSEGIRLVRH